MRGFGEVAERLRRCTVQVRNGRSKEALETLQLALDTFRAIDGLQVGDLASAAGYAESTAWKMDASTN